jgi:tRNA nucleotidyltransferase (CCA-adding enzyme)
MKTAGEIARARGEDLYLVGGVVRDLLLHQANLDLDLVVEGDAASLARQLATGKHVKVTAHSRFNTATFRWQDWNVDIAMARSETYARPGALPTVHPASIGEDLFRRDFTVNAMAVHLTPGHYGDLIDQFNGLTDLKNRLIRVLHDNSFIDDATRIWRAIRYEQRLGFTIETATLLLLKRDLPYLDTISGDRIRNELELLLKEARPEQALVRANELEVLAKVHSSLKADQEITVNFRMARQSLGCVTSGHGFALLVCYMGRNEAEDVISYLKIPSAIARTIRDTIHIMEIQEKLSVAVLAPSVIYRLLHGLSPVALEVASITVAGGAAQANIRLYLDRLRYIHPALRGKDLLMLGIPEGPRVKQVLDGLLYARLDGNVTTRSEEEEMVRRL